MSRRAKSPVPHCPQCGKYPRLRPPHRPGAACARPRRELPQPRRTGATRALRVAPASSPRDRTGPPRPRRLPYVQREDQAQDHRPREGRRPHARTSPHRPPRTRSAGRGHGRAVPLRPRREQPRHHRLVPADLRLVTASETHRRTGECGHAMTRRSRGSRCGREPLTCGPTVPTTPTPTRLWPSVVGRARPGGRHRSRVRTRGGAPRPLGGAPALSDGSSHEGRGARAQSVQPWPSPGRTFAQGLPSVPSTMIVVR